MRIRSLPSTAPGAVRRPAELVWCRERSYASLREPGGVLSTLERLCEASIRPTRLHPADLLGLARLASEATAHASDLVETVHHDILRAPWPRRGASTRRTGGIPGLVYRSVRGIAGLVTSALDAGWRAVAPRLRARESSPAREALLAAVNGVLGDHLAATGNPLALPMTLRAGGRDLDPTPAALARAFGTAPGRLVVLVHGLCRNDRHWLRRGHDHGAALARDLGVVPIYVRYNSGLHVSENGRALAGLLEALCAAWPAPLEELALVAHSMGGLVARSACHYGRLERQAWVGGLRRIVFLGTPHHGAPLERGGHGLETLIGAVPYAAALARLGRLRSAGITDLRHGYLVDEDWRGHDRFAPATVPRRPVPLPAGVECHALAATQSARGGRLHDQLLGDGLVPVASALGEHADPAFDLRLPESRRFLLRGASHLDLLSSREVYEQLRARLEGSAGPRSLSPRGR